MARFTVEIREIEIYRIEVDADDEDDALVKAESQLENANDKGVYHVDSDAETTVHDELFNS